jgi:cyclopropane fatty-acyl-phospholipid synthase-like methyltransferase
MEKKWYLMADYWQEFWNKHSKDNKSNDPQRQVLRTHNGEVISEDLFLRIVADIECNLKIEHYDELLDLCCGNGVITRILKDSCKQIIAVDFAHDLLENLSDEDNIESINCDIKLCTFAENSFDKILLYAGLQYFSDKETIYLFEKIHKWLRLGGVAFIGDIPDRKRIWHFFNNELRVNDYFNSVKEQTPIIGNWFDAIWLEELGKWVGFKNALIKAQPEALPYSHFRFDLKLEK